ncbi:MAG TPA: hypothetical protein VMM60_05665 [Ilumatobacter sp.]|nr:hypothetical protein [Ilumatobacter sp.]
MSVTLALSVSGLTIKAGVVAGLAIGALLLTGWRKPARAEPRSPREARSSVVPVDHFDTPEYRRPGPIRRLLALVASGGIALLIGVVTAIVLSFGIALAIVQLTSLLRE